MMRVISLGWGVQSWTLAAMVALGDLPPVDAAIHSDTTWEREATYRFAEEWTPWLKERGVRVVTVSDPKASHRIVDDSLQTHAPVFSLGGGQLRRSCTSRWKIEPIRRWITKELNSRGINKEPGVVEQWLGITKDEWHRAKDSDVQYIVNRYPLLERGMTRDDCLRWLGANGLPSPGKSACTFCPYNSISGWREMKREGGPDWQQAIMVDERIRHKRESHNQVLFIHPARVPLEKAVSIPEDEGMEQLDLINEECDSGYCML